MRHWLSLSIMPMSVIMALIPPLLFDYWSERTLVNASIITGWSLVVVIVLLATFNIRKRVSSIPLFSASLWLRVHIVIGFGSISLFLVHTGFSLPTGQLETLLWINIWVVNISGFIGYMFSRAFPTRMRMLGELSDIERLRAAIRASQNVAEQLMLRSVKETASETVRQLYLTRGAAFFALPTTTFLGSFRARAAWLTLERDIIACERYVSEAGKRTLMEFRTLAKRCYYLSDQLNMHLLLRYWLFIHLPAACSLVLFIALHIVFAYAFRMGGK